MTTYDNFAHTFSESRKNMKWEEVEYFLTKYAPFGGILDVGCGNGRFFGELKNQENSFGNYLGIDTSEKLLEEAHKLYPVIPAQAGIYEKDKPLFLKDSETTLEGYQGTKFSFQLLDMRNLSQLTNHSFDNIFFIASFHHLEYIEERIQVLQNTKNILKTGGKVFLTNWALESDFNQSKYSQSKIPGSENEFGGTDFQIKIGEFQRYYHSFTLDELEYFSKKAGFQMIENRLFDTEKNFITILQK